MKKAIPILFALVFAALGQPRGRLAEYAVILQDPPVAQTTHTRLALRSAQANAQLARIRTAQSSVLSELQRRKVPVHWSGQLLVNAITVSATPETAAQLRSIPGVAHVVPTPPLYMDLDTALDLTNVSTAWSAVGGASNAGAGIKIGIIDSGIDQNHPGFQDPSLTPPSGFPRCTDGHPEDCAYTNNKVIVARSYVRTLAEPFDPADPMGTAWPDDYSPRDRQGHGTAIAMIAAGVQNTSPRGPIQGVAPKAFLGNYKIFGTPGVNYYGTIDAFLQALQDALNDQMDVVTLSLHEGDPEWAGPLDVDQQACGGVCDVLVQAVENAVKNGMVVVTTAGNDGSLSSKGRTLTTIHTPGTAPSAITVGATMNAHVLYQAVKVSGMQDIHALFADGPHVASPLSAPIRDAAASGNDGYACSPIPAGSLSGAIALVQRGNCFDSDKIINAQNAGASAVVLYLGSGQNTPFSSLGVQDTGIPTVVIGNSDGMALKSFLASNQNASATLDPTFQASGTTADAMWPASSRGPSIGTFANTPTTVIKPELVAPGADLYTAAQKYDPNGPVYNSTGYAGVTGTSYAVPMVAGAVAILKQKFGPNLSPAQLKSLVVDTATQNVTDQGAMAGVDAAGAGKLNVGDAVNASATLVPDTISFGAVTSTTVSISRTVTITNMTGSTATFNFTVNDSNGLVKVSPSALTLAGGTFDTVTVSLSGNRPNPGSYEGFLVVSTSGRKDLHLPYQYLVGSGIPSDVFPLCCGTFLFNTGLQQRLFPMRLIDAYGVPVAGAPLLFNVTRGTARIHAGDSVTDLLGTGYVAIDFDSTPGEQTITGTSGALTQTWDGVTLPFPVIASGGAVDAATSQVGKGLAPGSYISIYGTGFADSTQANSSPIALPISLSTVSVSFFGGGLALPGHLSYISPGQVNVQVPWEFAGQSSVTMKVNFGGLESNLITVPLAAYSPGVFPGPAVQDSNYQLITASNPAKRGDTIIIYANGLGPVSNQPASGDPSPGPPQPLAMTSVLPTVKIGGSSAQVTFSGLTPGFVGLYQINAVVPADAPSGSQPLVVSINGVDSKPLNLAVQ